ncbi:hypothetical protein CPT_Seuss12 [Caulobacter phage Seuss]|uniref:Uncharacterized protein n=1 Tax=Caulobacter phage Seuss TaxID=1675601 RepID=A0A0K1LMV7_9CAUD|nr:hypothetical protein HOR08_gp012 [Caulobacter phage Seuss]AKU43538.1 hypothetical protein CPT_Seuss12 [Caulobacter phage Seuss]
MPSFHTAVRLAKFDFKDYQLTVNMNSAITTSDVGKPVTIDTSADNQVKLVGAGEEIVGIIYTVEDRVNEGKKVGTVEFHFAAYLPIQAGLTGNQVVARGKRLAGGGAGTVRALDPAVPADAVLIAAGAPRCWGLHTVDGVSKAIATLF